MTISEYRNICDNMKLDEKKKNQIKNRILAGERRMQEPESLYQKHYSMKKGLVLAAAACLLIGSITTVATSRNAKERPHMQNKVYIMEGSDAVIMSDHKPTQEMYDIDANTNADDAETDILDNVVLDYDSLEKAAIELKLSPIAPDTTDDVWEEASFHIEKSSEDTEKELGWKSASYFLNITYANVEDQEQNMTVSIDVFHQEYSQGTTAQGWTIWPDSNNLQNIRTYTDTSGREYMLYDMKEDTTGESAIGVAFKYTDRYWINEITREVAQDDYTCNIVCHGMSEKEVCDMLDQLSIMDFAY